MQPLVTVIIPAWNAQATLADTVRSLLAQTLSDWRALIIDDGSTDSTPMIASDFAWRDPRIELVRQPNGGLAAARNRGLDQATGRFVHFLDADDWLHATGLEQLTQAAEWSGRGAACGAWTLHQADGRPMGVTMRAPDRVVGSEHLLAGNVLAPHSHLLRRDLLAGARFDTSLPVVEDYDMWLRLAARGVRWAAVDEPVAAYRVRPGSLSKFPRQMLESVARVMQRVHTGEGCVQGLRAVALFYATSAALGPQRAQPAGALGMLRATLSNPAAFSASELGSAAYWSLVLGFGIAPASFGRTSPLWLPRLGAWWKALGCESTRDEALSELALEAVSAESVAAAMLDGVAAGSPLVLAGAMGRNGRVLHRAARQRGQRPVLRDDRLPRAGIDMLIDARSTVLVAPLADEPILRRLPTGVRVVRWTQTRRTLAADLISQLRLADAAPAAAALGA